MQLCNEEAWMWPIRNKQMINTLHLIFLRGIKRRTTPQLISPLALAKSLQCLKEEALILSSCLWDSKLGINTSPDMNISSEIPNTLLVKRLHEFLYKHHFFAGQAHQRPRRFQRGQTDLKLSRKKNNKKSTMQKYEFMTSMTGIKGKKFWKILAS